MPDIAMCRGKKCKLKETCYRYKAIPDPYWQAYFVNPPIKGGKCEWYWKVALSENNKTKEEI